MVQGSADLTAVTMDLVDIYQRYVKRAIITSFMC